VQYCKRPVELPDFWPPNSTAGLITFHYKICGSESTTKAQVVNDLRLNLFDALMRELEFNRVLLTMALLSGADVSIPASSYRMTVLIFTMT